MLVVGAGIVGRAVALELQRGGRDVVLVDPGAIDPAQVRFGEDFTGPASYGNAGHIATEQTRPMATPSFLLGAPRRLFHFGGALDLGWRRPGAWLPWSLRFVRACLRADAGERALLFLLSDAMPAWRRLAETLDASDLVAENGHLMLWQKRRAFQNGVAAWCAAPSGTARAREMAPETLIAVSRRLGEGFAGGIRFEGTGQVADPVRCMHALDAAFDRAGGRVLRKRVARLLPDGGGVVFTDGTILAAERTVLAAGVATARLLRGLGRTLPLVAERGYHVEWLHGTDWPFPPLVLEERSMIVSRFGDRLRASSFVEFDREDAAPDGRKWDRLETHVRALGLPVASPFRRWMGARPTLPDYLPAIGPLPGLPRLIVAAGHGHLGLTLAPRTAELVRRMLDDETAAGMAPFAPDRFGRRRSNPRRQ